MDVLEAAPGYPSSKSSSPPSRPAPRGRVAHPPELDETFGPRVVFQRAPPAGEANLPPAAGYQFFGKLAVDGASLSLTASLIDLHGTVVFSQQIEPVGRH